MSFGKRLQEVRKQRGLSQDELAKMLGTQGPAIGRYEREVAKPTIEVATKIASILEVSLDYLVGHSDLELDKNLLDTVVDIQKLNDDDKNHIMTTIDALLRDAKARKAYAS